MLDFPYLIRFVRRKRALDGGGNQYTLKTEAAIVRRLAMAKKRYEEGDVISYRLSKNRRGQFALSWKIDDAAGLLLILSWT